MERIYAMRAEGHPTPLPLSIQISVDLNRRHGIGTDASIPSHIKNIVERNYAMLAEGRRRRIQPTELGISLVQARPYSLLRFTSGRHLSEADIDPQDISCHSRCAARHI